LWKLDGTGVYDRNVENKVLQLVIPLPDGYFATIEYFEVDHAHKTLGTMTCLSGKNEAALVHMKE
jgi:hypothetical protein